jgi:hypothetical protein
VKVWLLAALEDEREAEAGHGAGLPCGEEIRSLSY